MAKFLMKGLNNNKKNSYIFLFGVVDPIFIGKKSYLCNGNLIIGGRFLFTINVYLVIHASYKCFLVV